MSNEIVKSPMQELATKLNGTVAMVIGQRNVQGFERAYIVANAIGELKSALTTEYMKPIMQLQGNRLGFKTDKDRNADGSKGNGYPEETVKNCLIEATLFGLETTGNQWNIIGGNMYATKEGIKHLLDNWQGLWYNPSFGLIKEDLPNYSAAVICNVPVTLDWKLEGVTSQHQMTIQIKANKGMSIDAVIGKATRKATKWLYDKISGTPIPEGEVELTKYEDVTSANAITLEEVEAAFKDKKENIPANYLKGFETIIFTKETQSYKKTLDYLNTL